MKVFEEPFEDLKIRQKELMRKWSVNPNNIVTLRKVVN